MDNVLAIVPARAGSKGIPNKNFRPLADGLSCVDRAVLCAREADIPASSIVLSTNRTWIPDDPPDPRIDFQYLSRPPGLAQDDTPMRDVIAHVLVHEPGGPAQIVVLLQPTQPLRTPAHIMSAVRLLVDSGADSVVSVVAIPRTHNPEWQYLVDVSGLLRCWPGSFGGAGVSRRQDLTQTYIRDGTVYAFWRKTLESGSLYGQVCQALVIPPEETCALDTLADWAETERRVRERELSRA